MNKRNLYTVKQLAGIAGISVRTLHYYDQIGLVKPHFLGENGYRYYEKDNVLFLQQVLFFRELGFSLNQIKEILYQPDMNLLRLLEKHKQTLGGRAKRLQELIRTIDNTIESLKGKTEMNENDYFKGFSDEKQAEYQKFAEEHWDRRLVDQSTQRWKKMTKAEREALMADGERITMEIVKSIPFGPSSSETQEWVTQWHAYINRFYDCSYEILLGLGKGYTEHPDFIAFYKKIHPALPEYLYEAIKIYCANHGIIG